jgi:hypothetical protein
MRRVRGKTLRDILGDRCGTEVACPHATAHLIDIYEHVCRTIAYAHDAGIMHRDLKPENIMVDDFFTVFVMDWGLSKRVPAGDAGDDDVMRTQEGTIKGTPAYMSPEQASGAVDSIDYRSDVFSLGIILYEILTGQLPFVGRTHTEMLEEILYHEPPNPRTVKPCADRELAAICMKALDKDPRRRYPTAKELATDIRNYREFRTVSAVAPRIRDRLVKWARRHTVVATAVTTLVLALGIAVAGFGIYRYAEGSALKQGRECMVCEIEDCLDRDEFLRARRKAEELIGSIEEKNPLRFDAEETARVRELLQQARAGVEKGGGR